MKNFNLLIALLAITQLFGQSQGPSKSYPIKKSSSTITLDGSLDESAWVDIASGTGFTQNFPLDSVQPYFPTEFKLTYDDQHIYVALICYEMENVKPISQSLRRDFRWFANDNAGIYFDPFNDKSNGFTFQVTPYNVQREGLVTLGGDVADDWDNKWRSATKIYEDRWVAEMAIPFKSIRYNSIASWGIQLIRNNRRANERSSWIAVPQQFRTSDLIYTGKLEWDTPPPEAGTNLSFIPFVTAGFAKDFEEGTPQDNNLDAGFDAKIGVTNSLNLDLTVNPDFSQVEVDRQVTNLNRFEIFFPERRQFFLENQDLFATNGFGRARPFFSRRIGIASNDDETVQVPIIGGARLSGKMGKNWRLGALTMQTQKDNRINQPAQNYSFAVVERQLFARSNVRAIFVNREATNFDPSDTTINSSRFNRVFGIDYNLASADNKWEGNFFYHNSEDPGPESSSYSHGGFISYNDRNVGVRWFHLLVGEDYNAEVGFVPRTGVYRGGGGIEYTFWSQGAIQRHGPELEARRITTPSFENLDLELEASYSINFLNTSFLNFFSSYNEVKLQDSFDPTNSDGAELEAGDVFGWYRGGVFFSSDERQIFNFEGFVAYGGFFNGTRLVINPTINYRFQPYLSFALDFEYNSLEFPAPYNSTDFYLVSPRVDLTLTTQLFFTNFVQYNSQANNLNINSRLQWRFQPVSDLFIVYTDNYFTAGNDFDNPLDNTFSLTPKNRALVIKLSYWFNL